MEAHYHPEGRVVFENGSPSTSTTQYNLTDHLGNTVVLFEDRDGDGLILTEAMSADSTDWEVLQRQYYYPFGMPMQGVWQNTTDPRMDYLYNGKELEEELSLHWLAYGFRHYDPEVGRFTGVDPLAFLYYSSSPYAYVENDPISHTDPTGMFKTKFGAWLYKTFNGGGQIEYAKDKGEYYVGQQVESEDAVTYKRVFRADSSKPSGGITNAIDYFPTGLGFAGKRFVEQGGHVENAGDVISGAGMLITPYAPPVGAEVMAYGEGVSLFGVGMQVVDIATSPEGDKLREIIKKVAVEGLPVALSLPLKRAIKNLEIPENEKKILQSLLEGGTYSIEKGMESPINETVDKIFDKIKNK